MLLKLRLLFFTVLLSSPVIAQVVVNGKVKNAKTSEAIGYANIGILNSKIGTLSNLDGSFSILVPAEYAEDSLTFTALGFGKKTVPVAQLKHNNGGTILLDERVSELNTVTVTAKRQENQTFELGNSNYLGGIMEPDSVYAGRAISLLIDNTGKNSYDGLEFPLYLRTARIRILRNNLDTCKFRIRLNEIDPETGAPGKDLLTQSIVTLSELRKGWLEFDLSSINLLVTKPFFITFEQILDANDRRNIAESYRKFIQDNPKKLVTDTVIFEGEKQVRQTLKGGGIDLPGTFIAVSNKGSIQENHSTYVRETSLGEWKKTRGILAATVTLSNQPADPNSAPEPKENSPEYLATQLLTDFMNETNAPGIQVVVAKADKVLWKKNMGYADLEAQSPVTDTTLFRLNSVSKTMTGVVLAKMASAGILDLDAPIQLYLPEFPEKKWPITTRQLAGHLAGIRDYTENDLHDFIRNEHYETAQDFLPEIQNDTLLFEPGSKFHYSTFGFSILGAIIEKVSGESYAAYMEKSVWQPAGLSNTTLDDITQKHPNRSKFYDLDGKENELGDWSYKYAGAGILSTAEDLARYGQAILSSTLIDQRTQQLLFTEQTTSDGKTVGYGLGWYLGTDKNAHRVWKHAGDSFSSSSFLYLYPDDGLVIALLSNSQDGAAFAIEHLASLFYEEKRE